MVDFIKKQGLHFLPHVLRRISDEFVRQEAEWYLERGVQAPPRTHSTMIALHQCGPLSVTELAALLRQSHPLVITWIRQLSERGLIKTKTDRNDGRRKILMLTRTGEDDVERQLEAFRIVRKSFRELMADCDAQIYEALWRLEEATRKEPFIERLRAAARR